ncbi:MAG: tRNA glutamyl-Q(34) synthetase GluQRS [Opitutales bacterium]
MSTPVAYRGRVAPTPTGYLHLGHARTFHTVWRRARAHTGALVLRIEDLDPQRCKPEYAAAAVEDLRWLGLDWEEGPEPVSGPHAPYVQSQRKHDYETAWRQLRDGGHIYPCWRSRKDLREAPLAPHEEDEPTEALYPNEWRPAPGLEKAFSIPGQARKHDAHPPSWRFRVPDGRSLTFIDQRLGEQSFVAGRDFGDFVLWNRDDIPAYELAVVVDDAAMAITEVVRGEDLLKSTARQLLLYEALGLSPPRWYHCPLVRDAEGRRLAKRTDALSLHALRAQGVAPEQLWEAGSSIDPVE